MRRTYAALGTLILLVGAAGALRAPRDTSAAGQIAAAEKFLAALGPEARASALLEFSSPARTDWHFIPKDQRKGLQLKLMTAEQRQAALALVRAGLSEAGLAKTTAVMNLEYVLRELEKSRTGGPLRDPDRYYLTVFGQPQAAGRWGWSLEGHHLSLNFVIDQGQVRAVTPAFLGANPGVVQHEVAGGPKPGTRVLEKEETLAFELLGSFSDSQRREAVVADKPPAELAGAGQAKPQVSAATGLASAKMTPAQQQLLWSLIEAYVQNLPQGVAESRLDAIRQAGVDEIHFAWMGAGRPGVGHYYRVQGPTFLIELVNVQPDSLGNPANHVHCWWRSLQDDFGLGE